MRPILKIFRNVFIYNEEKYQREVIDVEIENEDHSE